jgi:ATP-dependent Clp protease ATP-binding subunit ClpA
MDSNVKTNVRNISSPVKTFFSEMQELNIPVNNLTLRYQQGKTEEILYREDEYLFAVTTLNCRHKNNLAITGESGVGKTAFIHYLARYIGKTLPEYSLAEVSISSLLAGCAFRGEFEKKLTRVIEAAISCKAVVYFDEAHALSMTGGSNTGGIDAMNILKPYLTNDLRCVISTTTEESALLKNDVAFTRRFRFLELRPLTDEMKMNVVIAKFGDNETIRNYLNNIASDSKPLYEMIDDIDFLFSQHEIGKQYDEIHTQQ